MTGYQGWIAVAALNGAVATAAGAYGVHGDLIQRQSFQTGVDYHMWHSLALLGIAWIVNVSGARTVKWVRAAGALMIAGMVLFCSSVYYYGITGEILISGAAPFGGWLLIGGWLILCVSALIPDKGVVSLHRRIEDE